MAFRVEEDGYFAGAVRFANAQIQDAAITNAKVSAGAAIAAEKLVHQHAIHYQQNDGAAVAAAIVPIHVARSAATIVAVEVSCLDAPSGGDKTFTVDLQKANAGTPTPASVLTGAITYPNGTADCTIRPGTIASAAIADGDTLVVVVAVSGTTGVQGQGLQVTVTLREAAD